MTASTPDGYGRIPRWVLDRLTEIGPYAFCVYGALADYCGPDRYCRPSLTTLAARTGFARATVVAALRTLETAGAIRRLRGAGQRLSYHLPMSSNSSSGEPHEAGAPSVPIKRFTTCTGSSGEPVHAMNRTGSPGEPPSEQEPESRTSKTLTPTKARRRSPKGIIRLEAAEPPAGPARIVWRVQRAVGQVIVTTDLPIELHHIKVMQEQGWSDADIEACWIEAIRRKPDFARPRFLASRIGAWKAYHEQSGGNGYKPGQPLERKLCTWKGDKQYRVRERWDAGQGEWQEVEVL